MTRPIDEKIVVMRLDNEDFKKKAEETTSLFAKIKEGITKFTSTDIGKTTKDITAVANSVDKVSFDKLNSSIQVVTGKFTALGIAGVTALTNITNRAVDAGINLTKSLTLDQVTSGFGEYETKIKAIGTVLSNTEWAGTTLEDVKRVLEELNVYADQTVYSFGEMTENIGRWTAAGVKIDDAATAIKGLSNLAAASGSSVDQLNTAMYQMSQGMAAGKFGLEDWNSMVNAGMGGKKTQDALLETAKAMGKNVDMSDGFRLSLQQGWLTGEVFLETMKKFGTDKSMTEAATSVRTFSAMMDSLKEGIGSGWATTFEQIFGDFEEATVFWTKMSNAVGGFFAKSSDERNKLVTNIANKNGFLKLFDGIQNAIIPLIQTFEAVGNGFEKTFSKKTSTQIVAMIDSFKSFTAGLKLSESTMERVSTISQGFFAGLETAIIIVKQIAGALSGFIPPSLGGGLFNVVENIAKMSIAFNASVKEGNGLTFVISALGKGFRAVGDVIGTVLNGAGKLTTILMSGLGKALQWVTDKLAPFRKSFESSFGDFGGDSLLGAGTLAAITYLITKVNGIFDGFDDVAESFKETLEGVGESVQAFAMGIKIANLVLIAGALTMIAVSLKLLESIKTEDINKGIIALATSLGVMMVAVALIGKFNITGGLKASVTIMALATSMVVMAGALKMIADLDPEEMKQGLGGLVVMIGALVGGVTLLSKFGGKMTTSSVQLIALATSIVILTTAVKSMSSIKVEDITKSVIALGIIFAQLAIFLKVANASKLSPTTVVGLVTVSGTVLIMVQAIKQISDLDVEALTKGLVTITLILAQLALFSKVAGGPQMALAGAGMLLIAGALNALIPPIQTLGSMTYEELAKGLTSMALALVAVAGAGLLASGAIGGAVAITVIAGALNLLIIPIQTMSQLTWGEILKGIGGLALGLGVLAGVAALLTPVVPSILAFSGAIAILGVGVLAVGAGIALFGVGLATLATMTAASVAAIISALALLIKGLADLIPGIVNFVVELAVALVDGIDKLVPKLVNTIVKVLTSLLQTIAQYLPSFLDAGITIIIQLIDGIGLHVPRLVDAGVGAIVNLINGLAGAIEDNGPALIGSVLNLLGEILILVVEAELQVINALLGWIPGVTKATTTIGETAEKYIRENFGAEQAGKDKGTEFSKALSDTQSLASNAGKEIAKAGKEGAGSVKADETGEQFGTGFANGISKTYESVKTTAMSLARTALNAMKVELDTHSPSKETDKIGKDTGQGFSNGMSKKQKTIKKTAKQLASDAKAAFKEKLDEAEYKFEMGEIDSKKYISEIEKIRNSYSKYRDMVRESNLLIKKIREDDAKEAEKKREEELKREEEKIKKEQEMFKKQFDSRKALIDERKRYNQLSLSQELEAWQRMMSKYEEGTEYRKQAEQEVYRLKNEINNKMVALQEEYVNKILDSNNKLIEGEKALKKEYYDAVSSRQSELSGWVGIFGEVSKASEVSGKDLLKNLKNQYKTLEEWSKDIEQLSNKGIDKGLLEELRKMGPSAYSEIDKLTKLTRGQLEEYSMIWQEKNKLAKELAIGELEGMKADTTNKINELRKQTSDQLDIYKQEWITKMKEIRFGTEEQFVGLNASMGSIGSNTIQGMIDGMKSMKGPLIKQAKDLANEVSKSIKTTLKIKSPSQVAEDDGEYFGEGLLRGIGNKVSDVAKGAKNLALTAKDTLNHFIDGFDLPDSDKEIGIRAVVTYDGLMNGGLGYGTVGVNPDTSIASRTASSINNLSSIGDNNTNIEKLGKTIGGEIAKLQNSDKVASRVIVPVYLDGNLLTEVVSENQEKQTSINSIVKGVI